MDITFDTAEIAASYVITGRGARIKHVNVDGAVLCGKDKATQDASGRFEKLPVCGTCDAALVELKAQAVDAALQAAAAQREAAKTAPKSAVSATTRTVCTLGVQTAQGENECGAPATETWDASYGGIVVEEGRCADHANPAPVAAPQAEDGDAIEIHFSARVARFMADEIARDMPTMSAQLKAARLVRNGRGYTAFVTTDRVNATALLAEMTRLLDKLESGLRTKGLKGGMNFQPEAVAKGIEHITADLHRAEAA